MNHKITISDVARVAGVSPATVSRVLNRNPTVDPALVTRVETAIQEVNYRPNSAGRALRRQRSDLWAAIVPDVRNPFFYKMVDAFEQVAHAEGYSVILCHSQEDLGLEDSAIETAIAHQVSGIMIAAASSSRSKVARLVQAGIPVVSVDRHVQGFTGDVVGVDNDMIGWLAADHLLSKGLGSPVVLSHAGELSPLLERERGFARRMEEASLPVETSRFVRMPFRAPREPGAFSSHLRQFDDLDAVFATTNSLTAEAYVTLREMGYRLGCEVGLIGVDDDRWNLMVAPSVTVIEQPAERLGEWAGHLLATRLAGREIRHARITLDPELRVRESTAGEDSVATDA